MTKEKGRAKLLAGNCKPTGGVRACKAATFYPPVVDVCLRRKVHDGVNLLLFQDVHHQIGRLDVALDEPVAVGGKRGKGYGQAVVAGEPA
jgi:hypothetical protein